ncbi:MAG: ATP-binding protein [bacterium]|nr:ATP-binding protein [bacterium]
MKKPEISGNTIRVPSDQAFLPNVDDFLETALREYGADESVIADIAISVSELVNNAMMHGNKASPDKMVSVTVSLARKTATVTVDDEGYGFTPDTIQDPLADENLLKEVGRGIFIVRSLMDKVDINATDKGTSVSITKAI